MKRLFALTLTIVLLLSGCAGKNATKVKGDLPGILEQIYENYEALPEVKAALERYEAGAERREELANLISELQNQQWAEDAIDDEERQAEIQAEIDPLEAEQTELNELAEYLIPMKEDMVLTADMGGDIGYKINYFIGDGNEGLHFTEGYASEGMMKFSLVLLRMEKSADIEAAKAAIKNSKVNGEPIHQKWICARVDPGDVIVDNIGDLLILIMSDRSTDFHKAFLALAD